jgi:hypothetical protein
VVDQEGVVVLEAVEVLKDGRAIVVESVIAAPLQITNLNGHLGQLEGVRIDFDGFQLLDVDLRFQGETELRSEEMAVEMTDAMRAERPAFGHDTKEFFQAFGEKVWVVNACLRDFAKDAARQEAGILGEKTKDNAIEESGNAEVLTLRDICFFARFGICELNALTLLQRARDFSDLGGQGLGDLGSCPLRFEEIGVFKERAKNAEVFGTVNLVVVKFVGFLDRPVEVGADDVTGEITHHEQGRIQQGFAVAKELSIRLIEVLFLSFVFPGEATFFPDIGEAALARVAVIRAFMKLEEFEIFDDALLEAKEIRPGGVGQGWRGLTQKTAEIVEMLS